MCRLLWMWQPQTPETLKAYRGTAVPCSPISLYVPADNTCSAISSATTLTFWVPSVRASVRMNWHSVWSKEKSRTEVRSACFTGVSKNVSEQLILVTKFCNFLAFTKRPVLEWMAVLWRVFLAMAVLLCCNNRPILRACNWVQSTAFWLFYSPCVCLF